MKAKQLQTTATDQLVERYRKATAENWQLIGEGKTRKANRLFDLIKAIQGELQARGADAQRQLLKLLEDPDPGTRCWAASHTLELAPAEAERVLIELSTISNAMISFTAKMTLKKWKYGSIV